MRTQPPEDHVPDSTILDEIDIFAGNCVYMSREQQTVLVIACAISHDTKASGTATRINITGDSECGKSTAMDVGCMLSDNAFMSNCTQAAIRALFNTPDNHTLFVDEASKYFGESGLLGRTLELYKVLCEGYRRIATLSFSVNRVLTSVSCYGVAWTAGIGESVPADVLKRGVRIRMTPKPDNIEKWDTLDESVWATGQSYQTQLHDWVTANHEFLVWFNKNKTRKIHPKMTSRKRQIWGAFFAIANAAGGRWPRLVMDAFLALGIDQQKQKPTINQQIILDTADIIRDNTIVPFITPPFIYTIDLIENLPARDIYENWSEEFLVQALSRALGQTTQHRGKRFNEQSWNGKGRPTQAILKSAKEITEKLYPETEDTEDEFEDELGSPDTEA